MALTFAEMTELLEAAEKAHGLADKNGDAKMKEYATELIQRAKEYYQAHGGDNR